MCTGNESLQFKGMITSWWWFAWQCPDLDCSLSPSQESPMVNTTYHWRHYCTSHLSWPGWCLFIALNIYFQQTTPKRHFLLHWDYMDHRLWGRSTQQAQDSLKPHTPNLLLTLPPPPPPLLKWLLKSRAETHIQTFSPHTTTWWTACHWGLATLHCITDWETGYHPHQLYITGGGWKGRLLASLAWHAAYCPSVSVLNTLDRSCRQQSQNKVRDLDISWPWSCKAVTQIIKNTHIRPTPIPELNLTETTVSSYFWPPSVKPSNFYPSGACADAAGGWGTAPLQWPKICWYCIKDVWLWRTCPSFALSGSPCQEQPITSNQLVVIQIKVIKVIDHGFHQLKIHLVPQDACEGKKKEKEMHSE